MNLKIKVYFDYVCPYCIIAKKILDEMINGKNIEVIWEPFEICQIGEEKIDPINDLEMKELWQKEIIPLAKKYNIKLEVPYVVPHPYTNLAFQLFHFAKEYGKEKEYNNKVFNAFFYEKKDIANLDVLLNLCEEIGMDKKECLNVLENKKYEYVQNECLKKCDKENIEIIPTIIIGKSKIQGEIDKDILRQTINKEFNEMIDLNII